MIRIAKGAPPTNLAERARVGHEGHIADYVADPGDYRSGAKAFKPDSAIYGARAVKTRLRASHHGKCAYCEEHLPPRIAHGHVEHYRPVAFSQDDVGSPEIRPGYYWLAYDWDNFLWSCHYCNSTKKGNVFPLRNKRMRVRRHDGDVTAETPMLIKPDAEDPSEHIGWYREVPKGLTPRGRVTIKVLGLDLPAHETRLQHYRNLESAYERVCDLNGSPDAKARRHALAFRAFLMDAEHPSKPFSAMSAAFNRDNPLPPLPEED
ncbi:hypothetical protein [Sphingomonas sp. CLY1604]|uniref:hypothetical protein n=1 Tax=Sphingomonas sp. CLY1604 TaxID=3457786 RepID=UPI003FD732BC